MRLCLSASIPGLAEFGLTIKTDEHPKPALIGGHEVDFFWVTGPMVGFWWSEMEKVWVVLNRKGMQHACWWLFDLMGHRHGDTWICPNWQKDGPGWRLGTGRNSTLFTTLEVAERITREKREVCPDFLEPYVFVVQDIELCPETQEGAAEALLLCVYERAVTRWVGHAYEPLWQRELEDHRESLRLACEVIG